MELLLQIKKLSTDNMTQIFKAMPLISDEWWFLKTHVCIFLDEC